MQVRWLIVFICAPVTVSSAELQADTEKAWDAYIQAAESRLHRDLDKQFLWADQEAGLCERLQNGEIIASTISGKASKAVPHGLIHDWVGTVFVPKAALSNVFAVVQDYDSYSKYYGPTIRESRLLDRAGEVQRFRIRYVRRVLFVTAVLDAEYDTRYIRLDDHRWYSVEHSTCIHDIQNYGEPGQRSLPCDDGSGFLRRAYSISRFEERDQGVYVEQESIVLSRSIPVSLRWLIEPVVNRLSRELVVSSLRRTRDAVAVAQQGE